MKRILIAASAAAILMAVGAQAAPTFVEQNDNITQDTRWTRDNVYILRDVIYVVPPAVLTIEPGTVIRGVDDLSGLDETPGDQQPGALIVARGAKLIANGTADQPIYFTSIDDPFVTGGAASVPTTVGGTNVNTAIGGPRSYEPDSGITDNGFAYDQEWGGIVLLGEGPIGFDGQDPGDLTYNPGTNTFGGDTPDYPTGAYAGVGSDIKSGNGVAVALIEGAQLATIAGATYTDPFPGATNAPASGSIIGGVYGGLNRADNNGVLRFATSRFGGFNLGADNELNGITFGGTGTGFDCDWCTSYNNSDDGFEFFGGYTHFRYLFALYQGDDGFDGDQGFNGTLQHCFNIGDNTTSALSGYSGAGNFLQSGRTASSDSDNAWEWDGSEGSVQDGTVQPNTDMYAWNYSIIPSEASGTDGIRTRRGNSSEWNNGSMQDIVDDAFRNDNPNTSDADSVVLSDLGGSVVTAGGSLSPTNVTNAGGTAVYVAAGRVTKNGLDPRLTASTIAPSPASFAQPADRVDSYPYSGWNPAPFAGCMRDSLMMTHTILTDLEVLATTQPARPSCTIGVSGSNPTVSWPAVTGLGGRPIIYSIERSLDQKTWTVVGVVSDNDGAGTMDKNASTFALNDGDASASAITVTDTGATVTAGTPVYYRVIPL
ncbi:MAG: hypothetical protein AAF591_01020 [Verrucomicrobiota bacterium]